MGTRTGLPLARRLVGAARGWWLILKFRLRVLRLGHTHVNNEGTPM